MHDWNISLPSKESLLFLNVLWFSSLSYDVVQCRNRTRSLLKPLMRQHCTVTLTERPQVQRAPWLNFWKCDPRAARGGGERSGRSLKMLPAVSPQDSLFFSTNREKQATPRGHTDGCYFQPDKDATFTDLAETSSTETPLRYLVIR